MPRSARVILGILAAMSLTVAALGSYGSEAGDVDRQAPANGDGSGAAPEPPEGAAAVIDGDEISDEALVSQYQKVLAIPAVAEQVEAQGDAATPMLRAQVLSQILVSEILSRGAEEDFGIVVSDDEVRDRLGQMQAQAGGADEFGQRLRGMGTTEEMLVEYDLPFALLIERVQEKVAPDKAGATPPPAPPGRQQPPSEAQRAFQKWAFGKFAAAEVSVRSGIGVWDPRTGQVQPPGGVGGMVPGGQPQPG